MPEVGGGSLLQCCQWLSPERQTKLTKVHFETRELVLAFVAGFVKTPALPLNLIIQWIEVGWIVTTHYKRWSQGNLTCWNSKLETVKTISTPRKINAVLLNIKINQPKLVDVCGYILATNGENFTEIYLAQVKILQKVFFLGGATFLTHTVPADIRSASSLTTFRQKLKTHLFRQSYPDIVL